VVRDISFELKKGEILGVAGLMGAGRTELAKSIYGNIPAKEKNLSLRGEPIAVHHERDALREGVAYVSEDRKKDGLILGMSVAENVTLASLKRYSKMTWIMKKSEREQINYYKETLRIKTPSLVQKVKLLSGGNQQKVAIAKALSTQPKVLMLDEPTRGVDVGAKREIYELINELKKDGMGILMISSEIPELLGVCDRIMVMHAGRIAGILSREEATQESIMRLAVGAGDSHEKN
jgi:ribose transport system ATP-binding protein